MPKPRLTHEQHREIGAALHRIRNELITLSVQVANAYPRSGAEAKPGRDLDAALHRIDRARSNLEDALFHEHPQADIHVYYPGNNT